MINIYHILDYIIIGTGKDRFDLPDSFFEKFKKNGIKVDVVPTVLYQL